MPMVVKARFLTEVFTCSLAPQSYYKMALKSSEYEMKPG